ncbi:type II toxin-antitoxin system VapC family toxin [Micromonospora sp. DT81.3]|uniref:type II toxin-antitoxin system VapC family toxin n=1 Tax=Micromonospora sp. DT81.3 TaxID=3416523 RepID=UPI003CF489D2
MTRFAIDAPTAVQMIREGISVPEGSTLVAPNLLRSQALSLIYREVRAGTLDEAEARSLLDGITTMRVRLLGDRVSRGVAWQLAREFDWDDTAVAEYVAVAKLQADVFVTLDEELARRVEGVVTVAPFDALSAPG